MLLGGTMSHNKLLGEILVSDGYITKENLDSALDVQSKTGKRLGQVLLDMNLINSVDMTNALSEQGYKRLNLLENEPDWELMHQLEEKFMRDNHLIPYKLEGEVLKVVISDPYNYQALDYVRDYFKVLKAESYVGALEEISKTLDKVFMVSYFEDGSDQKEEEENLEEEEDISAILLENSPVVKFVNEILEKAISLNASDIHVEPQVTGSNKVRFRIDGELMKIISVPKNMSRQVVSRFKIMANMDIAKKKEPQDGEITFKHLSSPINMRVNTMPTVYGEKVVIRILGQGNSIKKLKQIGLSEDNLKKVMSKIKKKQGIILATGPTGSGKTTTLYSILSELNHESVNIVTIEDPVEMKLPNINQTQKGVRIDFNQALRAFLRQDPDIIMIGEIRDKETADIAVRASLTGHLLLSTIHTNDALGVVARFLDMGIEPYLIADALELVIAQRLVRKVCPKCKAVDAEGLERAKNLFPEEFKDVKEIYKGEGCSYCNNLGYKGRLPVHEIIAPNDEMRFLLSQKKVEEIKKNMITETIIEDGIKKVIAGKTTIDEVLEKLSF